MSLMKLLSVSRSFVNSKNQLSRYKMAEQGILPKFAPVGRPVSLAPRGNELSFSARTGVKESAFAKSATKHESATSMFPREQPPVASSSRTQPSTEMFAASHQAPVCVNAVPRSTNLFRMGKSPFTTHSAKKGELLTPIQDELSLDAVKVVRNDLSDADFDVVPAKPQIKTGRNQPRRFRLFRTELTGLAWSRLTARLFNSERVQT